MLSPTDNSYSSPLPKPAAGGLLDDPSGTASTQPIAKPQPSTQPLALAPDAPMPAPTTAPADATAPSAPAPDTPPPLATPDPLAFAPAGGVSSGFTPSAPTPVPTSMPAPAPTDPNGMPPATMPAPHGYYNDPMLPGNSSPGQPTTGGITGGNTPASPPSLPGGSVSGGPLNPTPAIPDPWIQSTDGGGQLPPSTPPPPSPPGITGGNTPSNAPVSHYSDPMDGQANPLYKPPTPPSTPAPIPTDANGMPSYSTTPTTPDNSLLNSTITPGPATDRYAIAQKEYDDWVAQSDPQFQAQMRDANRYSAAAGRIGSGQATNSIGDIATQRENATRSARDSFLGNALTGSIDDAYKNVGIAQQQQQFQAGQQQTAFGQNVELQQLANSEQGQQYAQMMQSLGFNAQQIQQAFTNAYSVQQMSNSQDAQSFYQALEQELQGSQGDPAQILAWISGQYARGGA